MYASQISLGSLLLVNHPLIQLPYLIFYIVVTTVKFFNKETGEE
jgi:hypothetical protein